MDSKDKIISEKRDGLWGNIRKKKERGERPARPGEKGYPQTLNIEGIEKARENVGASKCWDGKKLGKPKTKMKNGREVPNCEGYDFSNWREDFKAMEYEFIDLIKPEPLVSESSFEINKTAHNKEKRAAKIRTLSTQGSTEGERKAAQNKTKGPKLFGEACKTKKHGGDSAKPGPNKNYVKPSGDLEEAVRMPAKNGNIIFAMVSWRGRVYSLQMFFPVGKRPSRQEVQDQVRKVYPDSKLTYFNVRDYEPGQPLLQVEEAKVDKDKMKCNEPKAQAVGDSLTGKSHVVKACSGGEEKIIRFGQRGVKGSPKKEGESEEYAARRNAFKDRHAKNIAKGKMSAAYWANKVKW